MSEPAFKSDEEIIKAMSVNITPYYFEPKGVWLRLKPVAADHLMKIQKSFGENPEEATFHVIAATIVKENGVDPLFPVAMVKSWALGDIQGLSDKVAEVNGITEDKVEKLKKA